jgi:hypothetical protein
MMQMKWIWVGPKVFWKCRIFRFSMFFGPEKFWPGHHFSDDWIGLLNNHNLFIF